MKVDMDNKAATLSRCTETVHNARDQMRTLRVENEELKKTKENKPNTDKIKKQYEEEEAKTKDEKLKRAENDKRALTNNIAALEEQINNHKCDTLSLRSDTQMRLRMITMTNPHSRRRTMTKRKMFKRSHSNNRAKWTLEA